MKRYRAYAKVNIFLKITGTKGNYHELVSRFVKIPQLYDELYFVKKQSSKFEITGDFACSVEENTIYKAYIELKKATNSDKLTRLLSSYGIHVKKQIPSFAGLGGGSSDAAVFMKMCNEALHLGLSIQELSQIGANVGADVPFFIYGYNSANVSGIGDIVEKFDEETPSLEIVTPPDIKISTPKVYQQYRQNFYNPLPMDKIGQYLQMKSIDVLKSMDIYQANDLFAAAIHLYPQLKNYYKPHYFFSGSGSSFFYLQNTPNDSAHRTRSSNNG